MSLIAVWRLSTRGSGDPWPKLAYVTKAVGLPLLLMGPWIHAAQALSLREAAELALQNDPRIRVVEQSVAAARADMDVVRAGYLPSVSVGGAVGEQRIDFKSDFPAGFPEPQRLNPLSAVDLHRNLSRVLE